MQLKEAFLTLLPWFQPVAEPSEAETETSNNQDSPPIVMAAAYATPRGKKVPGRRSPAGPR